MTLALAELFSAGRSTPCLPAQRFWQGAAAQWLLLELTLSAVSKLWVLLQEEYEDSSGNVVNKKTYEDLKRQGLL